MITYCVELILLLSQTFFEPQKQLNLGTMFKTNDTITMQQLN